MTAQTERKLGKLMHIGVLKGTNGEKQYIYLRKNSPHEYFWSMDGQNGEEQTPVSATHLEEAIRLAYRHWQDNYIRMLNCGFRYTLPERDEHGLNALFYQMALSYSSMNGIYFDEDLGNNCFVQNASSEARSLLDSLRQQNRL